MEPTLTNSPVASDRKAVTMLPLRGRVLHTRQADNGLAPLPQKHRIFRGAAAGIRDTLIRLCRVVLTRARRPQKKLIVAESAALGDRRFISVVQFENQRFLIGSSPASVSLLACLPEVAADAKERPASPPTDLTDRNGGAQ